MTQLNLAMKRPNVKAFEKMSAFVEGSKVDFIGVKNHVLSKLNNFLPQSRFYHSIWHTLDVYNAVNRIANYQSNISESDLLLLKTAALFHDTGFIYTSENHEDYSIIFMEDTLPKFGYTAGQIKVIKQMIVATKPSLKPQTALEEILVDADLDYLGRNDYFYISNQLKSEIAVYYTLECEIEWIKLQLKFLKSHVYYSDFSLRFRKENKEKVIKQLESCLSEELLCVGLTNYELC